MDIVPTDIGIIILAAGDSSRLGSPKQLLKDKDGVTLIRRMNRIALSTSCHKVITILGANHDLIRKEIEDLDIEIIINAAWTSGMASSISIAIEKVIQNFKSIKALIFLVCDQPFVNKTLLDTLIFQYKETKKPIIASQYQNVLGTPALFDRQIFSELLMLKGDRGAGKVIHQDMNRIAIVSFEEGIFDIDTIFDYEMYLG